MKICYRVLVMSSALKQMGVNKNSTCTFSQLEKVTIFYHLKKLSFSGVVCWVFMQSVLNS